MLLHKIIKFKKKIQKDETQIWGCLVLTKHRSELLDIQWSGQNKVFLNNKPRESKWGSLQGQTGLNHMAWMREFCKNELFYNKLKALFVPSSLKNTVLQCWVWFLLFQFKAKGMISLACKFQSRIKSFKWLFKGGEHMSSRTRTQMHKEMQN